MLATRHELMVCAEGLRARIGASVLAISRFDPDNAVLRTLVNVGALQPGEEELPADERYEVDAFPATQRILAGAGYAFAGTDDADVASAALALAYRLGPQAAVPIHAFDRVWGELWIAERAGASPYGDSTLERLRAAASQVAEVLEAAR